MKTEDLKGINILVTGASDGIGKATAKDLIDKGARLAVHYHTNKTSAMELVSEAENGSVAIKANLEDTMECSELFHKAVKGLDRIDCMILNAGVFLEHSTKDDVESWYKTWNKTIAINLNSSGLLTKLGIEHFRKNKGGRFIYISSRAAFRGETEEYLAYAASKGGLTSLGRSVARSFGKENIKSFIIAPGFVKTKMAQQFINQYGKQRILDELSLNQLTEPQHISPIIALICQGKMDHATGATIDINAGSHIR